jgi:hypothetical protein
VSADKMFSEAPRTSNKPAQYIYIYIYIYIYTHARAHTHTHSGTLVCEHNSFRKRARNPKRISPEEIMETQMIRSKTQKYSFKND